jgi:mevalonate kinase
MNQFPAKLLLFGEYSVLVGSSALGIPVNAFKAEFGFTDVIKAESILEAEKSNRILKKVSEFFDKNNNTFNRFIDIEKFKADIQKGLFLQSNIPMGSGLGSSGALCAAIYNRYSCAEKVSQNENDPLKLKKLRENFSQMEAYFHGKSSGFDPLVSFLQKAILLNRQGDAQPVNPDNLLYNHLTDILLIDSGVSRGNIPFAGQFIDRHMGSGQISPVADKLISLADNCIKSLLESDSEMFFQNVYRLSEFQLNEMTWLIPEPLKNIWQEGLSSGLFALKLCGSGGGGFFTCLSTKKQKATDYFNSIGLSHTGINLF